MKTLGITEQQLHKKRSYPERYEMDSGQSLWRY